MRPFFFSRFASCRNASAIIEFAIVAPVLFILLIGIVETGLILATSLVLEGATSIGSRIGKTGFAPDGSTPQQYILQKIQQLSAGLLDPDQIIMDVKSYSSFSDIGQPNQGAPGTGGSGDVVVYRVSYDWPLFSPLAAALYDTGQKQEGSVHISAVATVRNEDFPGSP